MFSNPTPPQTPPPPPAPPTLASQSIMQSGAAERARLKTAEGAGFDSTDKTGGQGVTGPTSTTATAGKKSLLG